MSRPILPLVLIALIGITACMPDSSDGPKADEPKRGTFGENRPGGTPGHPIDRARHPRSLTVSITP